LVFFKLGPRLRGDDFRRSCTVALLALAAGCSTPAQVEKPFAPSIAGLPPALAREAVLLAGPEPTFSFIAGSTDLNAEGSRFLRSAGSRAVSGGWARVRPAQPGTAFLAGETQSHRFLGDEDRYVLQKSEALYLLGGLIAAGVQRSDEQGFFGFQVSAVTSIRGAIFPIAAGREMSFVLEGKTQKGEALSTKTTIRVLRELGAAERKVKIGGPLFLVSIERDGMLGLAPELAYEIDWSRRGKWPASPSTECVLYSEALGWPVQRHLQGSLGQFDSARVVWEARGVSRRADAPYAATNLFPAVRDGTTASSLLDAAYPKHRQGAPAAPPGLDCPG
jgi:hypothetical protein